MWWADELPELTDAGIESRLRQLGEVRSHIHDEAGRVHVLDCDEGTALVILQPDGRALFALDETSI